MFFFEILIPKNIRKGSLNNVNLSRWQEQARLYNTAIYELCLLNGELSKMVSIKNNSGNTMNLWSENSIKPGSNEDESRWELAGESLHECFLNFHCSVKRAVRVTWELTRVFFLFLISFFFSLLPRFFFSVFWRLSNCWQSKSLLQLSLSSCYG